MEERTELELLLQGHFAKLDDGRWGKDAKVPKCPCAEGLAFDERLEGREPNCLLCQNWNPRVGCVLASNQDLQALPGDHTPLEIAAAQAEAWAEVGHFRRAVARLDEYLRNHPDDADAYLVLAALYERPAYRGADKARVQILYNRYLELIARAPATPALEENITRVRRRTTQFAVRPVTPTVEDTVPLAMFTAFLKLGMVTHLVYGILTPEVLILAPVGDADPDTMLTAAGMGASYEKVRRLFRVGGQEEFREAEVERVQHRLDELRALPAARLSRDSRRCVLMRMDKLVDVDYIWDSRRSAAIVQLKQKAVDSDLLFPDTARGVAEMVHARLRFLIRRCHPDKA